jgi:hypothetical protein
MRVHLGCKTGEEVGFRRIGKRNVDHPSEIADLTKGYCDFSRFPEGRDCVAPRILSVQPDVTPCILSRWWTAMHYISRRNRESS